MARDLVLITGAARSGTSMVAGVLHSCGLNLGRPLVKPRRYRVGGGKTRGAEWEHAGVRQKVLKPLLRELGCDPRGQITLPPRDVWVPERRVARLRKMVRRKLGPAWGYKDAKVLLLWPIFHAAFPNAKWVLVRRDPKAIVDSCIRTPFMKGRRYKAGWIEWVQEHEWRIQDLKASGANVLEIWPDPSEPNVFKPAVLFCGLPWDAGRVMGALDPDAWHLRRNGPGR